jgi:hypothetical protein
MATEGLAYLAGSDKKINPILALSHLACWAFLNLISTIPFLTRVS